MESKYIFNTQPAGSVILRNAHMGDDHQDQQKNRENQQHPRRAAPTLIVDFSYHEHGEKSQRGEYCLPLEIESGIPSAGFIESGGEAGGKQHHKADSRQQQCQQQKGDIHASTLGSQQMLALHGFTAHFFRVFYRGVLGPLGILRHKMFLLSVI